MPTRPQPFAQLSTPFSAPDYHETWSVERFSLFGKPHPDAWLDHYGIPHDAQCCHVTVRDPLGNVGYRFELLGYEAGDVAPPSAPTFAIVYESSTTALVAVHRELRHSESPLWLTARWTEQAGLRITMYGLEQHHSADKLALMDPQGLRILLALKAVDGRPPDMEKAAFRQNCWDAYQKLLE